MLLLGILVTLPYIFRKHVSHIPLILQLVALYVFNRGSIHCSEIEDDKDAEKDCTTLNPFEEITSMDKESCEAVLEVLIELDREGSDPEFEEAIKLRLKVLELEAELQAEREVVIGESKREVEGEVDETSDS